MKFIAIAVGILVIGLVAVSEELGRYCDDIKVDDM